MTHRRHSSFDKLRGSGFSGRHASHLDENSRKPRLTGCGALDENLVTFGGDALLRCVYARLDNTLCRLLLGAALVTLGAGCDLFKELEGKSGGTDGDAAGDTDGADTDAGDGLCTYVDDYCSGQDILESCSPQTGEVTSLHCASTCGQYMNFTCLGSATGQHGCWCVQPGKQKLASCTDLESCLGECASDVESCADRCFGRTDAATIRLYGALIHCAEADCKAFCDEAPDACASCVVNTKTGLVGGCSVERSACDADTIDDFPWPG